jgi:hypothetical protein
MFFFVSGCITRGIREFLNIGIPDLLACQILIFTDIKLISMDDLLDDRLF